MKIRIKNGGTIRYAFLTHYEGPHIFFHYKIMDDPKALDLWANTY